MSGQEAEHNVSPYISSSLLLMCLMMSLFLLSQEGQEDGVDAASISRGSHRGSDCPAWSPAGPQPAPPSLLLQVHHLTSESPSGTGNRFCFTSFYVTEGDWPIRLQGYWLTCGGNKRTNGRAWTSPKFLCLQTILTDEDVRSQCRHGYRAHSWADWAPSSNALWAMESSKVLMM